jgi:hypothetical protein
VARDFPVPPGGFGASLPLAGAGDGAGDGAGAEGELDVLPGVPVAPVASPPAGADAGFAVSGAPAVR